MKAVEFHFDTKKILKSFPADVTHDIGYALHIVQMGENPKNVKKLKGFRGVYQITVKDTDGTYRTIFAFISKGQVDVFHAFEKKSNTGIKTPQIEIDKIRQRLKTLR